MGDIFRGIGGVIQAEEARAAHIYTTGVNRQVALHNAQSLREWADRDALTMERVATRNALSLRQVATRNADTTLLVARRNAAFLRGRADRGASLLTGLAQQNARMLRREGQIKQYEAGFESARTRRRGRSVVSQTLHRGAAEGAVSGSALLVAANQAAEVELEAQTIVYRGEVAASLADRRANTLIWQAAEQAAGELWQANAEADWLIWQANDQSALDLWQAEDAATVQLWEAKDRGAVLRARAGEQAKLEIYRADTQPAAPSTTPAYLALAGSIASTAGSAAG